MRWQHRLLAVLVLCSAFAGWRLDSTSAASGAGGALVIDCNATMAGVQSACTYATGATFSIRVNVPKAPSGGYFAHQTKVRWNDAQLDYLPASDLDTENLWTNCNFPVRRDNQGSAPVDPSVLYACVPFPPLTQAETSSGSIMQLQLRCQQNGTTPLTLVPRLGDIQLGTHFLDSTGLPIDPALTNATVTCGPTYGVSWGAHSTPASITAGETATVDVSFTNAGNLTWPASGATPVRLSYHWRSGSCSGPTAVWNGQRASLPGDVEPGGTVSSLTLQVLAPATPGNYCLVYDLVHEGVAWFSSTSAATLQRPVVINARSYGVNWGGHNTPPKVIEGSKVNVSVSFTNTSNFTWPATGPTPVRFSYHWRSGSCSGPIVVWDGKRGVLPLSVPPGGNVADVSVQLQAPPNAGQYCLVYDLVHEHVAWFSTRSAATLAVPVTVSERPYDVAWGAHTTPGSMPANTQVGVSVSFTNAGTVDWLAGGANPVRLSYHWRSGSCSGPIAVWNGQRASLASDVAPGGMVPALPLQVLTPSAPGTYCLVYDPVHEGVTWFSHQGATTLNVTVTVT